MEMAACGDMSLGSVRIVQAYPPNPSPPAIPVCASDSVQFRSNLTVGALVFLVLYNSHCCSASSSKREILSIERNNVVR